MPAERPEALEPLTYAAAGVDIDAADAAVEGMRDLVATTNQRREVIGGIGGFGGLFAVPEGFRRPVLVAGTDGVGTKMAVAHALGRFDTVGIDLVAMCVDDLVCCGAEPLFFLDYQLHGRIDPAQVRELMKGIAHGCRSAGCAILGGELAEHPGLIEPGEVDVAGFAVGIVERDNLIDGPKLCRPGDALLAIPSSGLRSNGYSLARRALLEIAGRSLDDAAWPGATTTVGDELIRPSVIYSPAVLAVLAAGVQVHAVAHITGGGLPGNLPRVLARDLDAVIRRDRWSPPRIFSEVQAAGSVRDDEMLRVFNMGIGMVLALPPAEAADAIDVLAGYGHEPLVVGELVPGTQRLRLL